MNEKEAREICSTIHQRYSPYEELSKEDSFAKGYLEAIEKAKRLEESVSAFGRFLKANPQFEIPVLLVLPIMDLLETLAKWEKEK